MCTYRVPHLWNDNLQKSVSVHCGFVLHTTLTSSSSSSKLLRLFMLIRNISAVFSHRCYAHSSYSNAVFTLVCYNVITNIEWVINYLKNVILVCCCWMINFELTIWSHVTNVRLQQIIQYRPVITFLLFSL